MLKVVREASESSDGAAAAGAELLDALVREGARQMLATALQAEVAAYIDAHADLRDGDGRRLVVRNGSHAPRKVMTAAGAVPVRAPRVNDKRIDQATGSGSGSARRSCPPGHASLRRSPRSCRCCICTG
jgi:hypothetical protein